MEKYKIYIKAFIALLFITTSTFSQGILQGLVMDSTTHEPLVGANVYFQGTSIGAATDLEGRYRIPSIPVGTYSVRVSYLGYVARIITVEISEGQTAELNPSLMPDIIEGNEVVITAQARGQLSAINQQLKSNTSVNVVSEEKIKELPDANAAEAIGRLPGVSIIRSGGEANKVLLRGMSDKFARITIDGVGVASSDSNSRGLDLSMFSQSTMSGVELYKSLTPDKDADAIAGSINLVTKKAPTLREIRADLKGDYNKLKPSFEQYDFSLYYGERFFDDVFGFQISGNLEQRDRSSERTNFNVETLRNGFDNTFRDWNFDDIILYFNDEIRKRNGVNVYLDFNTPDNGTIRFDNVFSGTKRDILSHLRDYPNGTSDLVSNGNGVSYIYNYAKQNINTYNSSLRGENHLFDIDVDWGASFSQTISDQPYENELQFTEPSSNDSTSGMINIPPAYYHGPPEAFTQYGINNFSKAYLAWGFFYTRRNIEKHRTAHVDLAKKYVVGDFFSGELKIGGKYIVKNRIKTTTQNFSPYYIQNYTNINNGDGTFPLKNFSGTIFENLQKSSNLILMTNFLGRPPENRNLFDKYSLYPLINRDAIDQWYLLNKHGYDINAAAPEYATNPIFLADYYDVTERVTGGYIMNTFNFGQDITLIAGYRLEQEHNDYLSRYSVGAIAGFPVPRGTFRDTVTSYTETNWLPHVHLTLRPLEFLSVRLEAYKALARPDFNYKLSKYVQDGSNNIVIGNPNLKSAKAWNYEFNTQIHSNTIGLISFSGYYKEISDLFFSTSNVRVIGALSSGQTLLDSLGITPPYIPPGTYSLSVPYNISKPTKVWGFEFEHQANLNFLPGYMQFIVLYYNVSIVRSETYNLTSNYFNVPETTMTDFGPIITPHTYYYYYLAKNKLQNQPELFGNLAVGYDLGGFSARLSFFFQDEFARSYASNGETQSMTEIFRRWDLSVKQIITENVSLLLNVNNLNDIYEGTFTRYVVKPYWQFADTRTKYGLTADLGVRISL